MNSKPQSEHPVLLVPIAEGVAIYVIIIDHLRRFHDLHAAHLNVLPAGLSAECVGEALMSPSYRTCRTV